MKRAHADTQPQAEGPFRTSLIIYPDGKICRWITTSRACLWPPPQRDSGCPDRTVKPCGSYAGYWTNKKIVAPALPSAEPQVLLYWHLVHDDSLSLQLEVNPTASKIVQKLFPNYTAMNMRGPCVLTLDMTFYAPHATMPSCCRCPVHLRSTDINLLLNDDDKNMEALRAAFGTARCGRHAP